MSTQSRWYVAAVLGVVVGLLTVPAGAAPLGTVSISPAGLVWQPDGSFEKMTLTVSGPGGLILRREFGAGVSPSFELFGTDGKPLPDGAYTYELVAAPRLDRETRRALAVARRISDDAAVEKLRAAGKLPSEPLTQSGSFKIANGLVVPPSDREERSGGSTAQSKAGPRPVTAADQVIPDDLIVQGSTCVGFDCVNNESFGFDTIRLKENNTRIKFEDTSVGSFPTNDWQLTANDSASGGSSKFSIEDITGAKVPFTITAGASTNSIFVDSTGRVGFRTSTPVLDIHIATSNTPAIRMEQNSSGGFTAQTWDIAGNEANFFVRDVTGGSRLPFRIRPGAPTSSVDISADGDVGVGTASPDEKLHVEGSDGDTTLKVEETNGTAAVRALLHLVNNGGLQILLERSDASDWQISNFNTAFEVSIPGSSPAQMVLSSAGNMTIGGTTYGINSSRDLKENFVPVDGRRILQRLVDMPLTEWNAKADPAQRHIGPVAEDWWATFGLGEDDKHVSMTDVTGVALAAIKGLHQVVNEKDATIAQLQHTVDGLQKQNSDLAARLAAIEQMLASQPE